MSSILAARRTRFASPRNMLLGKVGLVLGSWCFSWLLSIGLIFIRAGGMIQATDMETPVRAGYYFWSLWYPWYPTSLGSARVPNIREILYGFIAFVTGGSGLASQVVLLIVVPLISYISMLAVTHRLLRHRLPSAVLGSLIYAFSPVYIAWFTLPLNLGYALIPAVFYFVTRLVWLFQNGDVRWRQGFRYVLGLAATMGCIGSVLYHILPYLAVVVCVHIGILLASQRPVFRGKIMKVFVLVGCFVVLLFLVWPGFWDIVRVVGAGETVTHQSPDAFLTFYGKANVGNLLRLSGGSPASKAFSNFNGRSLGYMLPILAFLGFLLTTKRRQRTRNTAFYLSCGVMSLLVIGGMLAIAAAARSGSDVLTSFLLAPARRPERLLMIATFAFACMIAESLTRLAEKVLDRIGTTGEGGRVAYRAMLYSLIVVLLFCGYATFVHIYDDATYSQLYVPQPPECQVLENHLNEITADGADLENRFAIFPLYGPISSYEAHYHPQFLYTGTFGSPLAKDLVSACRKLVLDSDPASAYALGIASVKWAVTLPESLSGTALQPWRLQGVMRPSGEMFSFGDPGAYRTYFATSPTWQEKNHEDESLSSSRLFVNPVSQKMLYISPTILVAHGPLLESLSTLPIIDNLVSLSKGYTFLLGDAIPVTTKTLEFIAYDYKQGQKMRITIPQTGTIYRVDTEVTEHKLVLGQKSVLVFGKTAKVSQAPGKKGVMVYWSPASNTDRLSVWIDIKALLHMINPALLIGITFLSTKNAWNSEFTIRDSGGRDILNGCLQGHSNSNTSDNLAIYRVPLTAGILGNTDAKFLCLVSRSNSLSHVSLFLDGLNAMLYKGLRIPKEALVKGQGQELYVAIPWSKSSDHGRAAITLNYGVYQESFSLGRSGYTLAHVQSDRIGDAGVAIDTPIPVDSDRVRIIRMEKQPLSTIAWNMEYEDTRISSPVKWEASATINLHTDRLASERSEGVIALPLMFNVAYNDSWELRVKLLDNHEKVKILHQLGNVFGNLWWVFVDLRDLKNNDQLRVDFTIGWNTMHLALYRLQTSAMLLLYLIAVWWPALPPHGGLLIRARRKGRGATRHNLDKKRVAKGDPAG